MPFARLYPLWRFLPAAVLLAFLLSSSPLLQGWNAHYHMDAQVYLYAARQILEGKVLYRDFFDHKGPMMYVPEVLGLACSGTRTQGIWVLNFLMLLFGFVPLLRLLMQRSGILIGVVASLCWVAWLYRFMTVGDLLPELYGSVFFSLCLFFTLRIVLQEDWHRWHAFAFGVVSSCLLLLKLNFLLLLVPMGLWCLAATLKQARADRWSLFYLVGFLILPALFTRYFIALKSMPQALEAIWRFNVNYIQQNPLSWQGSLLDVLFYQKDMMLWMVVLSIPLVWAWFRRERRMPLFLLSSLGVAVLTLVAMPGRGNESRHYLMILAPLMAVWAYWIFPHLKERVQWTALLPALYFLYPMLPDVWHQRHRSLVAPDACEHYLLAHAGRKESLQVMGSASLLYVRTGLHPRSRFYYTYPILSGAANPLRREWESSLEVNAPDWVLVEKNQVRAEEWPALQTRYVLREESAETAVYQKIKTTFTVPKKD